MRFRHLLPLLLAFSPVLSPTPLAAQATRADSAVALLRAAGVVDARGDHRLARELLQYLARRFPETEAAGQARGRLGTMPTGSFDGLTRTGFFLYHTLYGAWLGVAVPAAFGADGSEPYGAGLLIGAPLGFFGSRALAAARDLSEGQAGIIEFGSFWGTWQGMGWQSVFDIGDREFTQGGFTGRENSETAPWAAAIIGGLTGLTAGVFASKRPIDAGTSSLVFNASMWGTGYGLAAGLLADAEGDDLLAVALIGGNVGLLGALPAASTLRPMAARVRTVSAAGLAGALAGLGVVLLAQVDSREGVTGVVTGGATVGLVTGVLLTRNRWSDRNVDEGGTSPSAVLTYREGWRVGLPMPTPALLPTPSGSVRLWAPGVRASLVDVRF